jgi:hypothetical protein
MIQKRTLTNRKDHIIEQAKTRERERKQIHQKRIIIVIVSIRAKTLIAMYTWKIKYLIRQSYICILLSYMKVYHQSIKYYSKIIQS